MVLKERGFRLRRKSFIYNWALVSEGTVRDFIRHSLVENYLISEGKHRMGMKPRGGISTLDHWQLRQNFA